MKAVVQMFPFGVILRCENKTSVRFASPAETFNEWKNDDIPPHYKRLIDHCNHFGITITNKDSLSLKITKELKY